MVQRADMPRYPRDNKPICTCAHTHRKQTKEVCFTVTKKKLFTSVYMCISQQIKTTAVRNPKQFHKTASWCNAQTCSSQRSERSHPPPQKNGATHRYAHIHNERDSQPFRVQFTFTQSCNVHVVIYYIYDMHYTYDM